MPSKKEKPKKEAPKKGRRKKTFPEDVTKKKKKK